MLVCSLSAASASTNLTTTSPDSCARIEPFERLSLQAATIHPPSIAQLCLESSAEKAVHISQSCPSLRAPYLATSDPDYGILVRTISQCLQALHTLTKSPIGTTFLPSFIQ